MYGKIIFVRIVVGPSFMLVAMMNSGTSKMQTLGIGGCTVQTRGAKIMMEKVSSSMKSYGCLWRNLHETQRVLLIYREPDTGNQIQTGNVPG